MGQQMQEPKIDYQALEQQRAEMLQQQLKAQLRSREVGRNHSLRRTVLRFVVDGRYEEASAMIEEYLEHKKDYPALGIRAQAHVSHAKDLIHAVRSKRNFPNLSQLSMSKQQEILEHALGHFEELKYSLRAIEHLVKDEAVKDIRSTVWVLRSLVYLVTAVVGTAFFMDFTDSLGKPIWAVFNDLTDQTYALLTTFLPFL